MTAPQRLPGPTTCPRHPTWPPQPPLQRAASCLRHPLPPGRLVPLRQQQPRGSCRLKPQQQRRMRRAAAPRLQRLPAAEAAASAAPLQGGTRRCRRPSACRRPRRSWLSRWRRRSASSSAGVSRLMPPQRIKSPGVTMFPQCGCRRGTAGRAAGGVPGPLRAQGSGFKLFGSPGRSALHSKAIDCFDESLESLPPAKGQLAPASLSLSCGRSSTWKEHYQDENH